MYAVAWTVHQGGQQGCWSRGVGDAPSLPRNCFWECRLDEGPLWSFDQHVPQRLGAAGHLLHRSLVVLLFILVHALPHVGGAMFEHGIDEPSQLVGGSRNGFGGAQPSLHPAEKGP